MSVGWSPAPGVPTWRRAISFCAALLLAGSLMTAEPAMARGAPQMLDFGDLRGWEADDHLAAMNAFLETCDSLDDPEWSGLCALAGDQPKSAAAARTFFEMFFRPVLIGGDSPALFTGYYEPELNGSLTRNGRYLYPLYRRPPGFQPGDLWYSRAEIEQRGLLHGRGLEIVWLEDPVEVFFLHVQGSGRIRLPDGTALRVGFDGKNGHPYKSVGAELVRRGAYQSHQVSARTIRDWVRRNPEQGRGLLQVNPSFVFFRVVKSVPADKGPLGAMGRSVTTLRSIAVDPDFTKLGAPVWVEKAGAQPMHRLMVAQDTGSAIKGAQRADIFYGTGFDAGEEAGRIRDSGRMIVLLPIQRAFAKLAGN